jgi:hypothetical protein
MAFRENKGIMQAQHNATTAGASSFTSFTAIKINSTP